MLHHVDYQNSNGSPIMADITPMVIKILTIVIAIDIMEFNLIFILFNYFVRIF